MGDSKDLQGVGTAVFLEAWLVAYPNPASSHYASDPSGCSWVEGRRSIAAMLGGSAPRSTASALDQMALGGTVFCVLRLVGGPDMGTPGWEIAVWGRVGFRQT